MMNNPFDRIEAHLRALFEENLPKIFTGHEPRHTLLDELVQVMQKYARADNSGDLFAPNLYNLSVAPEDMLEWQIHKDIFNEITDAITTLGTSVGLNFVQPPRIELVPDATIRKGHFEISAYFADKDPDLPDTAVMTPDEALEGTTTLPENAMLIIAGKTNFSLKKPIINIGRHSSNDLVLSDLHVSRHHAQLRAINDHFVIFDVGSTGGLFLNGKQITQATLHAGDVIRIGTVNLIYNQEPSSTSPTTALPVDNHDDLIGADR